MKDRGWNKIATIYIGTVIGAGFASGQEVIQFFGVFGYKSIMGLLLATILFSLVGAIILLKVYNNKIEGYEEYIRPVFGRKLGGIIELIITTSLFVGYVVMLAGSGAILHQQFGLSINIGIYLMALLTFTTFIFSVKGISAVNSILVPILLVGIVLIGTRVIMKEGLNFSNYHGATFTKTGNWATSAILYVSYNTITALVMMTSLLSLVNNRRTAIKGGVLGGIGLGVLAIFLLIPLLIYYTDVHTLEVPMLKVAESLGERIKYFYGIILWCAMFTTAIASGFGCIKRVSSTIKVNQTFVALIFCSITMPLAKIGFSKLVSTLYPIFGYLGLIILISIVATPLISLIKRN